MHIEYAADALVRMQAPKHSAPLSDQQIVESVVEHKEFLALADSLGDEKITSIAKTIRASAGSRYAKVTAKQKYAIAAALLARHGNALAVFAAAFGVSEAEFMSNAGK